MRRLAWLFAAAFWAVAARADTDRAGDFDYYVLALSWSPAWCALTGDARDDPQCAPGRGLTFVLHGLWPQHTQGWPSYCETTMPDPTPAMTQAMADIMGKAWLAQHQWTKHGRCSGLTASAYFQASRAAFVAIRLPDKLAQIDQPMAVSPRAVETLFLRSNPLLSQNQITVICKRDRIAEVRICLTRGLQPRQCSPDVVQDCTLDQAILEPVR